jgi:hypothetical protein
MKSLLTASVSLLTASVAVLAANSAQAFTWSIAGYECPATTCTDLLTAGYTVSGGGLVKPASDSSGNYLTPGSDVNGLDMIDDSAKVLSYNVISSVNNPDGATTKMDVSNLAGAFNFFWGSVDSYNTIQFFNGADPIASVTGEDVANAARIPGSGNYGFDAFVKFSGDFTKATLSSTGVAFEVAAVPEASGTLSLLALGAMSIGSLALKNRFQA